MAAIDFAAWIPLSMAVMRLASRVLGFGGIRLLTSVP